MRIAVEAWAPEYGSPLSDEVVGDEEARASTDAEVEVPIPEWSPRWPDPRAEPLASLLFVDGVRRIDAHVWLTPDDAGSGGAGHGVCASYAAGAVLCDGGARMVAAEVRRGLFCAAPGAGPMVTRHGTYELQVSERDDPMLLSLVLQARMGSLESRVAASAPEAAAVVVDGPLKVGQQGPRYVGYVKTHRQPYGPPAVREVVAGLAAGQRTPILLVGTSRARFTWYMRLPDGSGSTAAVGGWAGVVRLETSADGSVDDARDMADALALTLPRYASAPHKDPRAPQNLVPIGGLERELRRRLGDPALMLRALRAAAT